MYGQVESTSHSYGYVELNPPFAKYTLVRYDTEFGSSNLDVLYMGHNKRKLEHILNGVLHRHNFGKYDANGAWELKLYNYDKLLKCWQIPLLK